MPALALVLDGRECEDAARSAGLDRRTLRDWGHLYNADGLAGLDDRHGGGTRCRPSPDREAEIAGWMRTGPDPMVNGVRPKGGQTDVARRRCVDVPARVARLFGVGQRECGVGKLPHRLRSARVSASPAPS